MPVPKELVKVERAAAALKRLDVSPEAVGAAPQISPLLKKADGGIKRVLTAMRFAPDQIIASFLEKYDSIPIGDLERLPFEAIALAANLDVAHLLGSIMIALQAQAVNTSKILALTNHPKMVEARIKFGQMASGEKDRTALDMALGFLPSPKGPTFIGKAIFGKSTAAAQDDDDDVIEGEPDLERLFPPANAMQERLIPVRQRMLPPVEPKEGADYAYNADQ